MIEKILSKFREIGNIQFSQFSKPLIAVEDAIEIVQEVAKEYGKDTNVRSNADRIRSMSDEELVEFLVDHHGNPCKFCLSCWTVRESAEGGCKEELLQWLKSEVEK